MVDNKRLTPTIWVPLAQVRISERRRRSISQATVERYRQWLEQGREAPAVRLARQGDVYVVRDGRHRVAAALAAGHAVVKAELRRIAGMARAAVRRRSTTPRPFYATPGDEALTAERLACTEEERVRLPPSPLAFVALDHLGPQHEVGDCTRSGSWSLPR
jgi:hypothetical protein